jgi:anion-transporting  ArsA/GET3 family ATPase
MADDVPAFTRPARVAIVAGKGGVGSSTVAAAYALAAARDGADVLFVAVDGRPGMGPLLGGRELDATDRVLQRVDGGGRVRGRVIPADQAFGDYLELKGVGGLLRRAASAASLPMIAAATPGLEHLLVLGKIKELERERAADLIVVDAPPAGHAAPFLRSASGLSDVVTSGPVLEQASEVQAMLADPARCRAMIVTLPEETPVTEAIGLAADLRDELGITLLPTVLNACWPERAGLHTTSAKAARSHKLKLSIGSRRTLDAAAEFGRRRLERQEEQRARLASEIGTPVVELPRLITPRLGAAELGELVTALAAALAETDR